MQSIGLTGGIGSGKTTVAQILNHLGYAVYIADAGANRLMNSDPFLRQQLLERFGPDVYGSDHLLNKPWLAKAIFHNQQALSDINRLVHPRVMKDFETWKEQQTGTLVFFESAILFESRLSQFFEHVLCVTAPLSVRIQRVIKRDATTLEKVKERLVNQWEEAEKCRRSDFILYNDDQHPLLQQTLNILKQLETEKR